MKKMLLFLCLALSSAHVTPNNAQPALPAAASLKLWRNKQPSSLAHYKQPASTKSLSLRAVKREKKETNQQNKKYATAGEWVYWLKDRVYYSALFCAATGMIVASFYVVRTTNKLNKKLDAASSGTNILAKLVPLVASAAQQTFAPGPTRPATPPAMPPDSSIGEKKA